MVGYLLEYVRKLWYRTRVTLYLTCSVEIAIGKLLNTRAFLGINDRESK